MKSTLPDIKQLFNVKAVAYNKEADALAEGEFGIFPEGSTRSIASGAALPDRFYFVSKVGGKVYFSVDTMDKTKLHEIVAQDYKAETVNSWKTVLENCDCIKSLELNLNLDEQSLIQRDGLTWTHRDNFVTIAPKELKCLCDCTGKGTYDNHIMTKAVYEQIKAVNSPFYDVSVQVAGNPSAVPPVAPQPLADSAAIQAFIDTNKAVNTDDDKTNDSAKLELVITGKAQPATDYNAFEVNYVYPRGVKIRPAVTINGDSTVEFEQVTPLGFELGAGADMRFEEFENMNYYTDLNFYNRLSDGIVSGNVKFQFENGKKYNTIAFEFDSKKSGLEDVYEGKYKRFAVLLGIEETAVYTALKTLFGI